MVRSEDGVEDVGEKVGVLEKAQYQQIDHHAHHHHQLAERWPRGAIHTASQPIAQQRGEDEQQHEEATRLVVEEEADGEEVATAQGEAHLAAHLVALRALPDQRKAHIHQQEEDPKVNLREEERMRTVERQEAAEV